MGFLSPFSHIHDILIALGIIWVLTAINLFGVFISGVFQNIFRLMKIISIGIIIGISFYANGSFAHFTASFLPDKFSLGSIVAVGAALRLAFFAFSGWEGATDIAEEVENPRKNLPLSLFLGISGVLVLYLGVNDAFLYQVPAGALAPTRS